MKQGDISGPKSIREVITRETAILSFLLIAALSIFTAWQSISSAHLKSAQLSALFRETLNKERDSIFLQILLQSEKDLNVYLEQLKARHPKISFCIQTRDLKISLAASCQATLPNYAEVFDSMESTGFKFFYSPKEESTIASALRSMASPHVILAIAIAVLISTFINLRLKSMFSAPITELASNIQLIASGARQIPSGRFTSIREWATTRVPIELLLSHLVDLEAKAHESARFELARQVSHDIRSPLSALNMVVSTLETLPEEKRLIIRNSTQRINDIANSLLKRNAGGDISRVPRSDSRPESVPCEPAMLAGIVDAIISEKRLQFRDRHEVDIQARLSESYGLFVSVDSIELGRILSNLINNAIEACDGPARVIIDVRTEGTNAILEVEDNGRGIPSEIIEDLGMRVLTYGKELTANSGSGLGIYYAKKAIDDAKGRLVFKSEKGQGTKVIISIPKAPAPSWFVDKFVFDPGTTVISVDDDQTVHQIWADRLKESSVSIGVESISHISFSSPDAFAEWKQTDVLKRVVILMDHEFLGNPMTGLEAIERLDLASCSVLVTSRFEEPEIRAKANQLGVRLVPKGLASLVPIELSLQRIALT